VELLRPEVKEAEGESVAAGHLQCIEERPPEVTATQNLRRDRVFANRAWKRAAAKGRSSSLPLATRKLGGANVCHWDLSKYPANMGPSLKRQELWI